MSEYEEFNTSLEFYCVVDANRGYMLQYPHLGIWLFYFYFGNVRVWLSQ